MQNLPALQKEEMTLTDLMHFGAEHAKQSLVGSKDQYLTCFTLVKPNDHYDICATPWKDDKEKREAVLAVCLQALKEGVVAYSWVTECWFATSSFKGPESQQPPPVGPMPRDREDRKEGIVVIASDGKEKLFDSYEIIRDKKGTCIKLEQQEKVEGFESWITDALDRALALNALDKDGKLREKFKDFLQ